MTIEPYKVLQARVKEYGFQEKNQARGFFELALILGMTMGGIALFLMTDSVPLKVVAMLISTCGCLGMSTMAHTASHYTLANSRAVNQFLTYFGFPFFFGVSAKYWWQKHCIVHHPVPNVVGVDDDIDLAPFFAITDDQLKTKRGRIIAKFQWIVIPFALALNEFNIQKSGWQFLLKKLRDPSQRRLGHWVDLFVLCLHWATWVFVPMLFVAPLHALEFYAMRMALMGYAMFVGFAPAHFPAEAAAAEASEKNADFVLRQTATSVNFRTGIFGALLCGGVEYQIEHHLFQAISPYHYPELAKIVESFCREYGYPYKTLGWWEGTWKSLLVFYRPKKVLARLDECMDRSAPRLRSARLAGGAAEASPVSAGPVSEEVPG